jgi:bifunctional DNase/RNase
MTAEDAPAVPEADTAPAVPASEAPHAADAPPEAVPDAEVSADADVSADAVGEAVQWRIVSVVDVRMDLPASNPEVVLQETDAPWRELRIPVGLAEGNAIAYGLRGVPTARPLTHTLFAEVLERHGVAVEAARITGRQGRLFAAELETTGPRGRQVVECRPSDAIGLLLRQRMPTPLLVGDWVFDNAAGEAG